MGCAERLGALHWVAIEGLKRYGQDALAQQIGTRFLTDVKGLRVGEQAG